MHPLNSLVGATIVACALFRSFSVLYAVPPSFIRSVILADFYLLSWEVNFTTRVVTFEVKAKTLGYIGFGVNTIAGMKGGDIVIGGVYNNGTTYFSDRHGMGTFLPVLDKNQDWVLLNSSESDGWTTIKFSRVFIPCDQEEDLPFTNDTLRVIYSVGRTDELLYHHERRGTKSLILLNPPSSSSVDVSGFQVWDVTVNTEVPSVDTTHWDTIHRVPNFADPVHVVGFEPKLENELAVKYCHHIILYRCSSPDGKNLSEALDPWIGQAGGLKDDPEITKIRSYCAVFYYVWAKGGDPLFLPDHVGLPLGKSTASEYFLLEVHYSNPNLDKGVQFETGVRIYYSYSMRKYDAGILIAGVGVTPAEVIPPNVTDFVHVGHCSSACTRDRLPQEGIHFFSVLLHSHRNARKMKIRVFRDNNELPWMANDENFDFHYQEDRFLQEEVILLPGDQLSVECTYDTTWNSPPLASHGGYSSQHEMCMGFLMYYPLLQTLDVCVSYFSPLQAVFHPLGIQSLNLSDIENPTVLAPKNMEGLELLDALSTRVNWTSSVVKNLQYQMHTASHATKCLGFTYPSDTVYHDTAYPNGTVYEPVYRCDRQ